MGILKERKGCFTVLRLVAVKVFLCPAVHPAVSVHPCCAEGQICSSVWLQECVQCLTHSNSMSIVPQALLSSPFLLSLLVKKTDTQTFFF